MTTFENRSFKTFDRMTPCSDCARCQTSGTSAEWVRAFDARRPFWLHKRCLRDMVMSGDVLQPWRLVTFAADRSVDVDAEESTELLQFWFPDDRIDESQFETRIMSAVFEIERQLAEIKAEFRNR